MIPQRKRSTAPKAPDLEFDATQEIDPALVDSILTRDQPLVGDYDQTAVMLDLPGGPKKPAAPRR